MPSVRASCCPLPLATPSGECVNHQSSVTLLCLNYKWGLFSMIKQICHASGGNMMECLPSGGWFSLGLRPRENHPPSGKHSITLPPLAWHICIIHLYKMFSDFHSFFYFQPNANLGEDRENKEKHPTAPESLDSANQFATCVTCSGRKDT